MANTFKVVNFAAEPASAGTPLTLYTVPSSTTAVGLSLTLCNIHTAAVTASVQLVSDTSDTETNETVLLVKDAPIPAGGSLEILTGSKVVVQATDVLKIDCDVADKLDATLSIILLQLHLSLKKPKYLVFPIRMSFNSPMKLGEDTLCGRLSLCQLSLN